MSAEPGLWRERTDLAWNRSGVALITVGALAVRAAALTHSALLLAGTGVLALAAGAAWQLRHRAALATVSVLLAAWSLAVELSH